ncbi:MAG: hypothetical protein K2M50_06470 [Treponemataceae bacterium]|nr:hypothetical protein [Treponemataceae bacterium]
MESYKNLHSNSNIVAFDIGNDCISVKFFDGKIYRYSYKSAGVDKVERMKILARQGFGLNSYIMRFAKYDYER